MDIISVGADGLDQCLMEVASKETSYIDNA